ncbi:MAG: tetratricopeptide repeat protein [Pirellulaceae bacterium]|nr:tetratricopeptide repeat protein [Pirellulaceae bacterium]
MVAPFIQHKAGRNVVFRTVPVGVLCGAALVGVLLGAASAARAQEAGEFRTWTNLSGKQAELAFIAVVDGKLKLKSRDGKEFLLALDQFSSADRKYFCDSQLEQAVTLNAQGLADQALQVATTITTLNPQHAPAFLWIGNQREKRQEWQLAVEAYKKYNALVPSDVEGPAGLARSFEKLGNNDLAKFWYQRALELDPLNEQYKAALARLETPASPFVDPPTVPVQPPATIPTTITPPGPAGETKPVADNAAASFWKQGLVGILGGREVWWGRLIGILFHGAGGVAGAAQIGGMYRKMFGAEQAPAAAFFGSLFGCSIAYVIFWGIPSGWAWAIAVPVVLLFSFMGAGAATVQEK